MHRNQCYQPCHTIYARFRSHPRVWRCVWHYMGGRVDMPGGESPIAPPTHRGCVLPKIEMWKSMWSLKLSRRYTTAFARRLLHLSCNKCQRLVRSWVSFGCLSPPKGGEFESHYRLSLMVFATWGVTIPCQGYDPSAKKKRRWLIAMSCESIT